MVGRLISGNRHLALASFGERVQKAAAGFAALGIGRDDSVAIYLRNDFPFLEAQAAIGQLGGYSVPVNWHYTSDEAAYVLVNCGAKAVVIHADLLKRVKGAIPEGVHVIVVPTPPEIAAAYQVSPEDCAPPPGALLWEDFIARHQGRPPELLDAPGAMIYTSGTTGRPKGVRRAPPTPEQALASLKTVGTVFDLARAILAPGTEEITTVIPGPLYHSAPNAYGALAVRAGATIVLQPRFDPQELLALIERHKVTHIQMVPTMFVRLLKLPDAVRRKYDVSSLKFVVHAAAPCPPHVKKAMIEWWGPVINEYYGSTETGAVVFCSSPDWLAHPGTVGRPMEDVDLRILDDLGRPVARGVPGEIFCRLTTGADFTYHGDDEKRRKAERDGLISVGDIGYLDGDGFLHLCDRKNHMVISGGVNIYPAEIEAELLKLPGVADCAVFGIPDEEFGESLAAVIQPQAGASLTESGIRADLGRALARYKVPKVVEFRAELPREDSGKIFKRKLRDPYWAAAGRSI